MPFCEVRCCCRRATVRMKSPSGNEAVFCDSHADSREKNENFIRLGVIPYGC